MALLEVRGLEKYYGRRKVVDGVNFEVEAGEIVGLLGSNGAGKTTSFRMTTGQVPPYAGRVQFAGQDVTHLAMYRRARLGMGYLSQETSVFRKLSVEKNILAILEAMPVCRSLGRKMTGRERRERTDQILDQFGLTYVRHNNAARLSGGEKRRLEIARCLVCEPLLILLDEPFTGIDPKTIADIQQIVVDLCGTGIGILLTDHNVRETLKITDRSYLISEGQVVTHGTPAQLVRDQIAIDKYLGTGFSSEGIVGPGGRSEAAEAAAPVTIPLVLEHERTHLLVEDLRTGDPAAAGELVRLGRAAVPELLDALGRRDVELRRHALQVLEAIVGTGVAFDPFAPEAQRRQQLAALRDGAVRKAG